MVPTVEVRVLLPEPRAIVMAAGHGKRMRSDVPKALQPVANKPMLFWVLETLAAAGVKRPVVVVGRDGRRVRDAADAAGFDVCFATQDEPSGTAAAAEVGLAALGEPADASSRRDADDVVVLAADAPLIGAATIARLVRARRDAGAAATLLTAHLDDPTGYGRIVRVASPSQPAAVVRIVEHADATPAERQTNEVNASAYCFDRAKLTAALTQVDVSPTSGERYLTDAIARLTDAHETVLAVPTHDPAEILGANTPDELAACEAILLRSPERG